MSRQIAITRIRCAWLFRWMMCPGETGSTDGGVVVDFDIAVGYEGATLGAVPFDDAVARVLAFCTSPSSGWITYDLAGVHARRAGRFDEVSAWALLLADALAGQVSIRNVADFTQARRERFAELTRAVHPDRDLGRMEAAERDAVVDLCMFGFPGVWGPKVTKVAALYRPRAVPVLDGYLAWAFGFSREAFSLGEGLRRQRVTKVIDTLARWHRDNVDVVDALRDAVRPTVPEVSLVSDVRLLDIVIWTSQDDRLVRPKKPRDAWLKAGVGQRTPLDAVAPVRV